MGNAQSVTRSIGALDSFVAELGNDLVYDKSLGSARFLRTVKCRHKNGFVVVKIFIKRDPGEFLRQYQKRLKSEREALMDIPNVYTHQAFVETERAGYIIRQWVASNLYDRISTRPFLSTIEKKWIAFQLLYALRDARNRKVSHGDIKCENVLVTSWNWVYLSDFASYKPTLIPLDDPSEFSFYFDTSGRRICYLAPERFYASSSQPSITTRKARVAAEDVDGSAGRRDDGRVTEAMDCFSAGCVLAELFLEGAPLFTLSQLFKYRAGDYNVDLVLPEIEDEGVRLLIKKMISLDPALRPSFDVLLHTSRGTVFPESFYSFLHNYVASINEPGSVSPFNAQPTPSALQTPSLVTSPTSKTPGGHTISISSDINNSGALPNDSDNRMDRIWVDYESVEMYAFPPIPQERGGVTVEWSSPTTYSDLFPVQLNLPNRNSVNISNGQGRNATDVDGPALIVLALICANVRSCRMPSSRLKALDLCLALCPHLTDEAKLDRLLPYIVEMLHDDSSAVRAAACRTLVQVTMLVSAVTPFNAAIFPEYIIPNVAHLIRDPEESVRSMYAQCIVPLADTASRYLEMGQALRSHGAFEMPSDTSEADETHFEVSYDAALAVLQTQVQDQLAALLMDPSSVVKRAVLHNISSLCIFLGSQSTNDVLLSHMITYLNDRDWLIRLAFFESIVDVAACAGGRSLEEYILPLMVQALSDVEESVVAQVLASLTSLCELGLFQKMRIWELMGATLNFLYHPNVWIQQGAVAFMTASAKQLPSTDVWCILYPSLRHFLKADIHSVDEKTLLMTLKPALSRQLFDAAVQWAMKAEESPFWRGQRRSAKSENTKESMMSSRKSIASSRPNKSEEDEINMAKLRHLGLTASDEGKLLALRDCIAKLAAAISSFPSRFRSETDAEYLKTTGDVELQKLKIVPQTIFIKPRTELPLRSPQAGLAHRRVSDLSTGVGSPRLGSRRNSVEQGSTSGAGFEDLRRRLATLNNTSSTSLSTTLKPPSVLPAAASLMLPSTPLAPPTPDLPDMTPLIERPGSPAESVVSTANSSAFRAMHRFQVGTIEASKAAPAIGASKANAIGLFENVATIRSEGSPERHSSVASPRYTTDLSRGPSVPRPRVTSTYDGREQGITLALDHLYTDTSQDLQNDFGPSIPNGPSRRRTGTRNTLVGRDGTLRRPEALLVAHLASHSDAITGLAVSPDHTYFVSASSDGTVKIWDSARLERNVSAKPRHTYNQHHSPITALCTIDGSHCFASAARDGSLHVVRVHVTLGAALPKYGKVQVVREHRVGHAGEHISCMCHYNTDTTSTLIYGTTHSLICVLDLRTMRVVQSLEHPRHLGAITALLVDRKRTWVLTGTATGVLILWDLRFGLRVRTWRVGTASSHGLVEGPNISSLALHPTKGKGRWVIVTLQSRTPAHSELEGKESESTQAEVWDIEQGILVERYLSMQTSPSQEHSEASLPPPAEAPPSAENTSPAAAIAALVRMRQAEAEAFTRPVMAGGPPPPPSAESRSLLVGVDLGGAAPRSDMIVDLSVEGANTPRRRGYMVTGAADRRLRLWSLNQVDTSVVLSGPPSEAVDEAPLYSSTSFSGSVTTHLESWPVRSALANKPANRRALVDSSQQALLRAHSDTICALATIEYPFRGGIISGDRAGVIKVWRVEGSDS